MTLDDKTDRAEVRRACIRGLNWGLEHALENDEFIDGYPVDDFENNLLRPLLFACGAGLLGDWLDVLLEEYMSEVQSSAALAVNCFGPLLLADIPFDLGVQRDLRVTSIGRATRRGFYEPDEPALHVTAVGPSGMAVIDISCLDYLTAAQPAAVAHADGTALVYNPPAELDSEPRGEDTTFDLLDVASLTDRARDAAGKSGTDPATLFYVYWEPLDAGFSPLFARHRQEIESFAGQFAQCPVRFEAISCFALWDAWAASDDPRLREHALQLRARYEVPAWAWEMVEWKNGRLQSADWMMDLAEDPEANRAAAKATIKRSVEDYGFSKEEAHSLFGNCLRLAEP